MLCHALSNSSTTALKFNADIATCSTPLIPGLGEGRSSRNFAPGFDERGNGQWKVTPDLVYALISMPAHPAWPQTPGIRAKRQIGAWR